MNPRIQKLYDQCFVVLEDQSPNTGFDFEKFAQLIVRECANVAQENSSNQHLWIMKHFNVGVEK